MGRITDRLEVSHLPNAELKAIHFLLLFYFIYLFFIIIIIIKIMEVAKIHDAGATLLAYTFCGLCQARLKIKIHLHHINPHVCAEIQTTISSNSLLIQIILSRYVNTAIALDCDDCIESAAL